MKYTKKENVTKECAQCYKTFDTTIPHKRLCSPVCKTKFNTEKTGRTGLNNISTGTMGAISELVCAADLMLKGYAVFRAISPSCSCDLLAMKNGITQRVEVRTGYKDTLGKISWNFTNKDIGRQDLFAIYIRKENCVKYFDTKREPLAITSN